LRAVVVGGTGLVGTALLRILSEDARYASIVSLARRAHDTPPRVEARLGFDVPPCDVGFCALGTTIKTAGSQEAFRALDHDLVVQFAQGCKDHGARGVHVVSAVEADPISRVFYSRVKGEMERDVRSLAFELACAYRPSFLMGERVEPRAGERIGIVLATALKPITPKRYRGIQAHTVARAMARHAVLGARGWHVHENVEIERLSNDPA
jgi:uncharacterized protein YbjT (DUF2867 family)